MQEHALGKLILQFDYCYTFTDEHGEQQIWDPNGPRKFPQDLNGTMLVAATSDTKTILAIPVLARRTVSLKMVTDELVKFGFHNSQGGANIYQAHGERSCKQVLKAPNR